MSTLVVYDSQFGNTALIAETIGSQLKSMPRVLAITNVSPADLQPVEFLIIGSPTQGGRPTARMLKFLQTLPKNAFEYKRVVAFDTRISAIDQKIWLRTFMNSIGYAAPKIAKIVKDKGATLIAQPEGFFVEAKEGPLKKDELKRAATWAKTIQ
ncbi:flavodoxin [Candidatus Microgenomates bacterium]|nr:MAG: flavodoxin [Candidatus Microgenomates bacterium]